MLGKLVGLEKMSILQCQELAKKFGYDNTTFDLVGPKGRIKAKWKDAYFGLFTVNNETGFMSVKDIEFVSDIWCENLMFGKEKTT